MPLRDKPGESLVKKVQPRVIASKSAGKKIRVHTIRHAGCVEFGHDKFDEKVTDFLNEIGEANLIGIHTTNYTYLDVGTQKIMMDFGVLIVYGDNEVCARLDSPVVDYYCRSMNRRFVVLFVIIACVALFPFRSPAPLIYTPGEGWYYEAYGEVTKWQRARAKDQLDVAQQAFDKHDYGLALRAAHRVIRVWPLSDYAPARAISHGPLS